MEMIHPSFMANASLRAINAMAFKQLVPTAFHEQAASKYGLIAVLQLHNFGFDHLFNYGLQKQTFTI